MSSKIMRVLKRNGESEDINYEKIHKVLNWAAEGLDVSISEVELNSRLHLFDGIKSKDIQETMIKSSADLISEEYPDYQYMSARLSIFNIRKESYGKFEVPPLLELLKKGVEFGYYDRDLLEKFSEKEIETLGDYIDHSRDLNYSYSGTIQLIGKYLNKNRVTNEIYESPQIALILLSMAGHIHEENNRMEYIKTFYDLVSTQVNSVPTPIMAGLRTPIKQFSSCVTIDCDDSLDSIMASTNAIIHYISKKAGIGLNVGRIRPANSEINKGSTKHTGLIPFIKLFQSAVGSCSQGGIRDGCVQRDSYVERLKGFVYEGIEYLREDILFNENNEIKVSHILYKLSYLESKELRYAYLQNLFMEDFSIKKTSNNNS